MPSGSGLMKTKPPHVPTRASGNRHDSRSASISGNSAGAGVWRSDPSSRQVNPWKLQRNSLHRPSKSFNARPRCRQALT